MNDQPETNLPAVIGPSERFAAIMKLAADPNIDVGKITALIELDRGMQRDQAKREFDTAFAALSAGLPTIKKNGEVKYPEDKTKPNGRMLKAFNYARYEDILELVAPLLKEHKFQIAFDTEPHSDGKITVIGFLRHAAGHEVSARFGPLMLDTSGGKNNIQAVGSTFSYGKRYVLTALLNLVFEGEDDDGVRGGTILIDAASVKQLSDMILATSGDEKPISLDRYLAAMEVETLADIRVEDFQRAQNLLLSRMSASAVEKWRAGLMKGKVNERAK